MELPVVDQLRYKAASHSRVVGTETANLLKLATCGAVCAALLMVAPASRAQAQSADGVKPDLSGYVSQDLDPGEQSLISTTLSNLPRQMQEQIASQPSDSVHIAIVEGGTGIIHYNRAEDVGNFEVEPGDSLPGDEYPFAENTRLAADEALSPDSSLDPGSNPGTGPYRRVYTPPVTAAPEPAPTQADYKDLSIQNAYMTAASVSIECEAGSFTTKNDIGYSYMGGWSGTWNSLSGSNAIARAIDAGLQYSPANENYAMIMAIAGGGKTPTTIIHQGTAKNTVMPPRIECANGANWADVYFSAYGAYQLPSVAPSCWTPVRPHVLQTFIGFPNKACNTYALALTVASNQFSEHLGAIQFYYIVYFSPSYKQGGWGQLMPFKAKYYNGVANVSGWLPRAPCGNCAFKWMTSIAQATQNLTDKSWYGATWSNREITDWPASKDLVFLDAAGTNCTEYPLWHKTYPAKHSADCGNTPAGMTGLEKSVTVKNYAPTRETDLISLSY